MWKVRVSTIVDRIHWWIFGNPISSEMRRFLDNLTFSFFFGFLASLVLFLVNATMGRALGPSGFGEYNYFLSLAMSSTFFFLLGTNISSTRYISDILYERRRGALLSAAVFIVFLQATALAILVFILRVGLTVKFDVTTNIIVLMFIFGLIFSMRELFGSTLRALGYFKQESVIKLVDAGIVVCFSLVLYALFGTSFRYTHYVFSFIAGATIFSIFAFYILRHHFSKFSVKDITLLFQYNKFLIIAGISGLLLTSEKAFIGKYVGGSELGLYSAYYASSQATVSAIGIMFMNVFWPNVIKNKENLQPVIEKLKIIFYRYFPVWLILNCISTSTLLFFFGKQYPHTIPWIILFATSSLLNITFFVFMSILNIHEIGRATIINTIIYSVMVLSIVLLKNIPMYLLVQIITYSVAILYIHWRIKEKYLTNKVTLGV